MLNTMKMDPVIAARDTLKLAAKHSAFARWVSVYEIDPTVQSFQESLRSRRSIGAAMRFIEAEDLDTHPGDYALSLTAQGRFWTLGFGKLQSRDQAIRKRFDELPGPFAVAHWLDSDLVVATFCASEPEFAAYRLARALHRAFLAAGKADGFTTEQARGLMPGTLSEEDLRQWMDEVFAEWDIELHDVGAAFEDYLRVCHVHDDAAPIGSKWLAYSDAVFR